MQDIFAKYNKLKAISFVGSHSVIEELLLPNFKEVNLILGLEDSRTADILEEKLDIAIRSEKLVEASDEFLKRYVDETLKMSFTKQRLIHTKLYIMTNDADEYCVLTGSVNHPSLRFAKRKGLVTN